MPARVDDLSRISLAYLCQACSHPGHRLDHYPGTLVGRRSLPWTSGSKRLALKPLSPLPFVSSYSGRSPSAARGQSDRICRLDDGQCLSAILSPFTQAPLTQLSRNSCARLVCTPIALTTAAVPLPVNLLLDMGLASKGHHPLNQILNSVLEHNPQSAFPSTPPSALVKHRSSTEAKEIYFAAHPTRTPHFLAQRACHKQEAKSPTLWGFTWSATTLIPAGTSYSYMGWEVRREKRGLGTGMWTTSGQGG